jgi:hypothetical protein
MRLCAATDVQERVAPGRPFLCNAATGKRVLRILLKNPARMFDRPSSMA